MTKAFFTMVFTTAVAVLLVACAPEKNTGTMTGAKLAALLTKIDKAAERDGNTIAFKAKDRLLMLVFDENANRMRIMAPVVSASSVPDTVYKRMLQANYDTVLDSRYAVADDLVWAMYVHPLSSLTEEDFVSGVVQTVTAAETFGSSYSSGAFAFGSGDSDALQEELLKKLEEAKRKKEKGI